MKFYDNITITLQSGKWWNGAVAARREAWVPYGWPRWWNGGKWWSVYLVTDRNINTLLHLKYKKTRSARDWEPWRSKEQYGKAADDLYISVPVWTIIKDHETWRIIYQATQDWEKFEILVWWAGGVGNMHFKNSVVQYPDFGLLWEPAKTIEVDIEIQLLWDIWLIWFPSVGKSSIINSISNTKAKVADYHFTTLIPNLGSIKYEWYDYNIVDIPGIIPWANEGRWLGLDFLRHVLKARIFNFVMDISRYDEGILEFGQLRSEIISYCKTHFVGSYEFGYHIDDINIYIYEESQDIIMNICDQNNETIINKKLIRTINKIDEVDNEEIRSEYLSNFKQHIVDTLSDYIKQKNILTFEKLLDDNIYMSCTIDYDLMQNYKHILTQKLNSWADIQWYIQIDTNSFYTDDKPYIKNISDELYNYDLSEVDELDFSEYENYIAKSIKAKPKESISIDPNLLEDYMDSDIQDLDDNEEEDNENILTSPQIEQKHRLIYDYKLNKLVYQMMRGNAQAEHRFWNAVKTMWYIRRFSKNKVKPWHLLVFKSIYNNIPNKVIRYW